MIARYNIRNLIGLFLAVGSLGLTELAGAQPQGNLKVSRFEFGMFPNRATVAHTFWFKPGPKDTIRLLDIKTGCGCVRAEKNQNFAAPGDSLPVTLLWTPSSETDSSQVTYVFFVGAPDPTRLTLAVGPVTLDPVISVTPVAVEFPTAKGAQKESAGFRVSNLTEHDLDMKIVSAPTDKITVSMADKLEKRKMIAAQVGLNQPDDTTRFERSLTIEATDAASKRSYRLTVPIHRGTISAPTTTMTQ